MTRLLKVMLVVVLCCVTLGCNTIIDSKKNLPQNAVIVTDHGNGWIEFMLGTNRYLLCEKWNGERGFMCITQIHDSGQSTVAGYWEEVDGELRYVRGQYYR